MFKIKTYKYHTHLAVIASLIGFLCILVLFSFRPKTEDNAPLVKAMTNTEVFPTVNVDGEHTIGIDVPEELPFQKFESEKNLSCEFNKGVLHVWYNNEDDSKRDGKVDYQIVCNMNCIKIYDGKRLVGTLSYDKSSLGRMILNDNQ